MKKIILLLSIIGFSMASKAQTREYFEYRKFSHQNTFLSYRLLKPNPINETKSYPLVIFLASETQNGTDNEKQLNHFILELAKISKRKKYPAIVIAPQISVGKSWSSASKQADSIHFKRLPSKSLRMLSALITKVKQDYPVDSNRVYLIGISDGATAAYELMCRRPDEFAGVVSISGSGDIEVLSIQNAKVPYWAFLGQKDEVYTYSQVQKIIDKMKQLGGKPKFSTYPYADHLLFDQVPETEIFDWLFAQSK